MPGRLKRFGPARFCLLIGVCLIVYTSRRDTCTSSWIRGMNSLSKLLCFYEDIISIGAAEHLYIVSKYILLFA